MRDEVVIEKVIYYITSTSEQLQVASVFCITNLMRDGGNTNSCERQAKLRELGVETQLQTLLYT